MQVVEALSQGPRSAIRYSVLGPLAVRRGGEDVNPGPYKQRVLLGAFLLRPNTTLHVAQLLHALWDEDQPRTARKNLQVYVSALRRIVGDRIVHRSYGYLMAVEAEELDLLTFDGLVAAGRAARRAGDLDTARLLIGQAARTWTDSAAVDLIANPYIAAESRRLDARRLGVLEDWFDLEIEAGHHLDVLDVLSETTARNLLRERLTAALMTALDRSGDRSEALACYESHRQLIARELGLDPSPVLQQLYGAILAGSSSPRRQQQPSARQPQAQGQATVLRPKPAQLPRDMPDFVGRAQQLRELATVLSGREDGVDVAVIGGAVASGKTALAVRAGHLMADQFPDGQVFVSLTAEDGAARPWREVLVELMHATGLEQTPAVDDSALTALWRSWVVDRRFLFVLDDAVSEQCVRRLLPGAGPSRTLVTSTRRLSGLESVHRLESGDFTNDEALELLERSLGASRMRGAADAVARITHDYGGLPPVIRAMATRLTLLRHVTPQQYADWICARPDALDELTAGGQTLRHRFCRFHTGLSRIQQEAFRSLGRLPGPRCGHDDLFAALAALDDPAERALELLMEANLVAVAGDSTPGLDVPSHPLSYATPPAAYRFAVDLT